MTDEELDRKLKEEQLANEKRKGGCGAIVTGLGLGFLWLLCGQPVVGIIVFVVFLIIGLCKM